MKITYDREVDTQLDAVAAVTHLFDGQPQGVPEYAVINLGAMEGLFAGQGRTELGVGNRLLLTEDKLRANLRVVQTRNDIEVTDPAAAPEAWERRLRPPRSDRLQEGDQGEAPHPCADARRAEGQTGLCETGH
ncbi:MAG: hypothetical protein ACT4QB_13590 [Gammaproteobacteria bacterium]